MCRTITDELHSIVHHRSATASITSVLNKPTISSSVLQILLETWRTPGPKGFVPTAANVMQRRYAQTTRSARQVGACVGATALLVDDHLPYCLQVIWKRGESETLLTANGVAMLSLTWKTIGNWLAPQLWPPVRVGDRVWIDRHLYELRPLAPVSMLAEVLAAYKDFTIDVRCSSVSPCGPHLSFLVALVVSACSSVRGHAYVYC